jgi:hypothetical protein
MAGADYAFKWLTDRGYQPHQAAGIVGHLVQESGVNPTVAPGDNGTANGIAQWRGPRFVALQQYAAQNGQDWRSMDAQLGFLDHELNTSEKASGDALRASTDVRGATRAFMGFERPQGWTAANPEAGHGWANRFGEASRLAGTPIDAAPIVAAVAPQQAPPKTFGDVVGSGPQDPQKALGAVAQMMLQDQEAGSQQKLATAKAETARRKALFTPGAGIASMYG